MTRFYNPLRQIAALWASFQVALAAWTGSHPCSRSIRTWPCSPPRADRLDPGRVLEFKHVSFPLSGRQGGTSRTATFALEKGKTYALVGPTGGGKTTTASLMARLYDPTEGARASRRPGHPLVPAEERTKSIGFILQEPFLFTGTIRDNIVYGNDELQGSATTS